MKSIILEDNPHCKNKQAYSHYEKKEYLKNIAEDIILKDIVPR
jgi:hypothetical protein